MSALTVKFTWLSVLVVLALAGLVPAGAPAQAVLPNDDEALEAEGHGHRDLARDLYARNLKRMAAAPAADAAETARRDALAEVYLHAYVNLAIADGRATEALALLDELEPAPFAAVFHGWRAFYRAAFLLRLGRIDEAERAFDALGLVRDWRIIGPFSNEGGRAAREAYPPERELKADATYEGALRPVAWRAVPVRSPAGVVDLTALLRPAQDVVAYALCFVRSDVARPAAVRVASGEGIRVWVNDALVLEDDAERESLFDQDAAAAILRRGWNKVLVKVLQKKGAWTFRLRLTDPEGLPLSGLETSSDPAHAAELGPVEKMPPPPAPARGALDYFTALHTAAKAGAADLACLGFLHTVLHVEDRDRHAAMRAYRAAVEARPEFAPYRFALARASQVAGSMKAETEENVYRDELEATLAKDSEHVGAILGLAGYYLESMHNTERARQYLKRAKDLAPDLLEVKALEISVLAARGHDGEADLLRRELLAHPEGRLVLLLQAAERELGEHRPAEALRLAEAALVLDVTNTTARDTRVECLLRLGRGADAIAEERSVLRFNPWALGAWLRVGRAFEAQGRYAEAEAEYRKAVDLCPEDDQLLAHLGNALHLQGRTPEAMTLWNRALELNPRNVTLKRYVEFLHQEETPFETPFREDLAAYLPDARAAANPAAPAVYALYNHVVKVNKDGTSAEYYHQIFTITNEKGISDFDVVNLRASAGEEKLKVLNARVVHHDGTQDEARINTLGGAGSAIDLPPLTVGDVVEVEYRREALRRGIFGDYFGDRTVFASTYPVKLMRYVLLTPPDRPIYTHKRNLDREPVLTTVEGGKLVCRTWELRDLPHAEVEPHMPDLSEFSPTLYVTTYKAWPDFVAWYNDLIRKQCEPDEDIRAKVHELTDSLATRDEKIRAIYNFVVGEIRYVAWEFGIHGYKPYRAAQIFARKFGDCKDKALLINTMLKVIGIEGHPVLINAEDERSEEDLTAPMVEHFNHCIACVREGDRDLFLDGTASFHSMDSLPAMDMGATVLVVDDQGGRIAKIPVAPPEQNLETQEGVVSLQADGRARLRLKTEMRGPRSVELRYQYSVPERRKLQVERALGAVFAGAQVESLRFSNFGDLDHQAWYIYTALVPALMQQRGEEWAFRPALFPEKLSATCARSERKHDLLLGAPRRNVRRYEFTIPPGLTVKSLPEPSELETPFGAFSGKVEYDEKARKLTCITRMEIRVPRVRKEEYATYREFCNAADFWEAREVTLEKNAR